MGGSPGQDPWSQKPRGRSGKLCLGPCGINDQSDLGTTRSAWRLQALPHCCPSVTLCSHPTLGPAPRSSRDCISEKRQVPGSGLQLSGRAGLGLATLRPLPAGPQARNSARPQTAPGEGRLTSHPAKGSPAARGRGEAAGGGFPQTRIRGSTDRRGWLSGEQGKVRENPCD